MKWRININRLIIIDMRESKCFCFYKKIRVVQVPMNSNSFSVPFISILFSPTSKISGPGIEVANELFSITHLWDFWRKELFNETCRKEEKRVYKTPMYIIRRKKKLIHLLSWFPRLSIFIWWNLHFLIMYYTKESIKGYIMFSSKSETNN